MLSQVEGNEKVEKLSQTEKSQAGSSVVVVVTIVVTNIY